MGLNELVLKVPGSEVSSTAVTSTRPPVHQPPTSTAGSEKNPSKGSSTSGSGNDKSPPSTTTTTTNLKPIRRKSIQKNNSKTHSRESSGASNLSVKFSVSDETASVSTASNPRLGSRNSNDREVEEDLTLSDRLSHEDLDMDDGFHQGSKSCESIPQDRLTPDDSDDDRDRRMLPGDSKSQNSDYGSFCQTPSDNFGHLTTSDSNPDSTSRPPNLAMTGTDQPPDHQGDHDHQDLQRQPLLPPDIQDSSSDDDAGANSSGYTRRKAKHRHLNSNDSPRGSTALSDTNTDGLRRDLEIKGEPVKTLLAGIFLVFAWVATTTSLALTHERVPDYDPLPDVILDNIKYQSWGLDASEIVIMVATLMAFAVSLFHKHRFIVLRRIFLLVGIHYYYRALTMYVTALPKPNEQYQCAPKTGNETTPFIIFQRVLKLLSGMGLSINGKHVYCGDYIYSGHTMTLIMTYLVIKEYSPRRWFLFHWFSLGVTTLGIVTLLLSRGHYSIDVVIAYWITTRLWWMYHTLANHEVLKSAENSENYLNKIWWWYIFNYFEGRVPHRLPREYGWPIPEKLLQWNFFRRRNLETSEEDLEAGLSRQPSQHRD